MVADSILDESEATSWLVSRSLLLSPACRLSMAAAACCDSEVLRPSVEPSRRRSLETVLLLTNGEVCANPAARSISEEEEARADSCVCPIEAKETASRVVEDDFRI